MGMRSSYPGPPIQCSSVLVLNLSVVCWKKNWDDYEDEEEVLAAQCSCYPLGETVSMAAGIWCAINAIVGSSGNLLTLLAIPAAKRKRRSKSVILMYSMFNVVT